LPTSKESELFCPEFCFLPVPDSCSSLVVLLHFFFFIINVNNLIKLCLCYIYIILHFFLFNINQILKWKSQIYLILKVILPLLDFIIWGETTRREEAQQKGKGTKRLDTTSKSYTFVSLATYMAEFCRIHLYWTEMSQIDTITDKV